MSYKPNRFDQLITATPSLYDHLLESKSRFAKIFNKIVWNEATSIREKRITETIPYKTLRRTLRNRSFYCQKVCPSHPVPDHPF